VGSLTLATGLAAFYVAAFIAAPREPRLPGPAPDGPAAAMVDVAPDDDANANPAGTNAGAAGGALSSGRTPREAVPPHVLAPAPGTVPVTPPVVDVISTGSLVVDSRPRGAEVYLNDRRIGLTPLEVPDVPVGHAAVRIERAGYRLWSSPVEIVPGQRVRVAASLEGAGAR